MGGVGIGCVGCCWVVGGVVFFGGVGVAEWFGWGCFVVGEVADCFGWGCVIGFGVAAGVEWVGGGGFWLGGGA